MSERSAAEEELAALHASLWAELHAAARDRAHGWRTLVLATRHEDEAEGADARTVVLREVDADTRVLRFYTDARTAKLRQIARHERGSLVAWCPRLGWQLRLRVRLWAETEGLSLSSRWAQLKLKPAAQDYMSALPPGSPLHGGADAPAPQRDSRAHFALVHAEVLGIDWLGLRPSGHRRALFDASGARWVAP